MESEIDGLRATEAGAVALLREALARRRSDATPTIVELAALDGDVSSIEDLAGLARQLAAETVPTSS